MEFKTVIVNKDQARQILREEAAEASRSEVDPAWEERVRKLAAACQVTSKTYIAALGTGLLAKATDLSVDPLALKVKSGNPGAYSARSLAKDVLAAEAPRLEIDLGATGREPLNNQPFFRYDSISREMDVRSNSRGALDLLCTYLEEAAKIPTQEEARAALRAFLRARQRAAAALLPPDAPEPRTADQLLDLVERFVTDNSEGGKRAQAVAAGLLCVTTDPSRVESSRVNDPDRHIPADIGIRAPDQVDEWVRVFEVRDKPVESGDLYFLIQKAHEASVSRAAMIAVAAGQRGLDLREVREWAAGRGIALSFFAGWPTFVDQVLFWSACPTSDAWRTVYRWIDHWLRRLEVTDEALEQWANWNK